MAKHHDRLPKEEVEKIFYKLCLAICEMKNTQEAAEFLRDLLSYQEAEMVAKRLRIAEMILQNKTYEEIKQNLKVGSGKIARVQEWLKISGEGYRRAIERTVEVCDGDISLEKAGEWQLIKKKYPAYFWPEMLLENVMKSSGVRQREKIRSAIREMKKMKEKTALYRKINRIMIFIFFAIIPILPYLEV